MKYLVKIKETITCYVVVDANTVEGAEHAAIGLCMSDDESVMVGEHGFDCVCKPVD